MITQKSSDLNDYLKVEKYTIPQAVSVTKNPAEETKEQIIERQEKFLKLPEEVKTKLVSQGTSKIIQDIGKVYNLELMQLAEIARAVRSYYFGEVKSEDFPTILSKEMGIDVGVAQEISKQIIEKIINENFLGANVNLIEVTLSQALKQFPKLGDQAITLNPLKSRHFSATLRPSIKNWIADYYDNLGPERHGSMERADYLYHSENGKRLTQGERQKVAQLLKSLDEESNLKIDSEKQEIVFEVYNPASEPEVQNEEPTEQRQRTYAPLPRLSQALGNGHLISPDHEKLNIPADARRESEKAFPKNGQNNIGTENYNDGEFAATQENSASKLSIMEDYFQKKSQSGVETPKAPEMPKNAGNVEFSSPQVFSEELEKPAPPKRFATRNLGISYEYDGLDEYDESNNTSSANQPSDPRIKGNVVDLRN